MGLVLKQWISTIDARTTLICLELHGVTAAPGEAFDTATGRFDEPPCHWHCRSVVAPWTQGKLTQMRDDANRELQARPEGKRDIRKAKLPPAGPHPDATGGPSLGADTKPSKAAQKILDGGKRPTADSGRVAGEPATAPTPREWSDDEYVEWRTEQWSNNITEGSREGILRYGSTAFNDMNGVLRDPANYEPRRKPGEVMKWIDDVNRGLDQVDPISEPTKLFRGVGKLPQDPAVGAVYMDSGFVSASTSRQIADQFKPGGSGWLFNIRVPSGQKILPVMEAEREMLLPPGSMMQVVSVDRDAREIVMEVIPK